MVEEYFTIVINLNYLGIQPFFSIVATPLESKKTIVYFDSIKFKVLIVIRSIDLCFKIF